MIICLGTSKIFKLAFKAGVSVHNHHLNLFGQVDNSKWILCSRKISVKCGYLRFLMYKTYYMWNRFDMRIFIEFSGKSIIK